MNDKESRGHDVALGIQCQAARRMSGREVAGQVRHVAGLQQAYRVLPRQMNVRRRTGCNLCVGSRTCRSRPVGGPGGGSETRLVGPTVIDGVLQSVVDLEDDALGAVLAVLLLVLAADDGEGVHYVGFGGPAGDAYVELHVEQHRFFQRKDDNIHVEVPVTLKEAVLGARIEVPTIGGSVAVTVPKGSNTGTTLRLRDRGIRNRKSGQRGHQFITLKVFLPEAEEPELVAFLDAWQPKTQQDPRKEMLP